MGSGKSKAIVAEASARSVLGKRPTPSEVANVPVDELTRASGRAQLDPEVLKEISKWSTVKTTAGSNTKRKQPPSSSSFQYSQSSPSSTPNQSQQSQSSTEITTKSSQPLPQPIPTPKLASIIRFQEIEKHDKEWNEKQQIEGRLTEEQLKSIMTLLRNDEILKRSNSNSSSNNADDTIATTTSSEEDDITKKLSIDFKIPLNQIILLQRHVKIPKLSVDREDEHLFVAS